MEMDIFAGVKFKKCCNCGKKTQRWQSVNGSPFHCYDGCYGTTGYDFRTADGKPQWEQKSKE